MDENRNQSIALYLIMPLALFVLYLVGMAVMPRPGLVAYELIHGESPCGIIENATALFFALGAALFLATFMRAPESMPKIWRCGYVLLSLAALFVALEEINYGQFFFGFDTPEMIGNLSTKNEFNLHNLFGNKPARRLNLIATIGFPALFIILPLVVRSRLKLPAWFRDLAGWFLPGRQLMLFAVLAQAATWLDDFFGLFGIANAWTRATEFKEMYWGLGVLLWARILHHRLRRRDRHAPPRP